MFVSYDNIEFQMMRVEEYLYECIYDRSFSDHIYNNLSLTAVCVLNRDLTDAGRYPPGFGNQGQLQNNRPIGPAGTVPDLEKRLGTPRKQLRIYSYTDPQNMANQQVMVEVPKTGLRSDCLNGPHCRVLQILPIGGYSSYVARMQFAAALPICSDPDYPPIMLSNRWEMKLSTTDDYFSLREFSGIAHFRLDMLAKKNLNPRFFQSFFFYPVEPGYRRLNPEVIRNAAGDQVMYNWVDVQTPFSFPGGVPYHATRAEVMEYRTYMRPGSSARQFFGDNQMNNWRKPEDRYRSPWERPA